MDSKRYIAEGNKLLCPYCNQIVNGKPFINHGCYRCGGLINKDLSPREENCDNLECSDSDFIIGCSVDKFYEDRLWIDEP